MLKGNVYGLCYQAHALLKVPRGVSVKSCVFKGPRSFCVSWLTRMISRATTREIKAQSGNRSGLMGGRRRGQLAGRACRESHAQEIESDASDCASLLLCVQYLGSDPITTVPVGACVTQARRPRASLAPQCDVRRPVQKTSELHGRLLDGRSPLDGKFLRSRTR
jgi:hypothetical protein